MVLINESCIGCGLCLNYCPVRAISLPESGEKAAVDLDICVECGTCYRAEICPVKAITYPELSYPRILRRLFSDPTPVKVTGVPGRGTEEIKTNDVTDRFRIGEVGICVEVGRPGIGASLRDVEKVTRALAERGVDFEEKNPVRSLIDVKTGEFKREVLDERVLSIIIEFTVPEERMLEILNMLKSISRELDTVFSLSVAAQILEDNSIPAQRILKRAGIRWRPNAKVNLGMGRAPKGGSSP